MEKKQDLESIYPKDFPIGPGSLDKNKLKLILKRELQDWRIVQSKLPENPFIIRKELYREYKFDNFNSVIGFINKAAVAFEAYPHHPRWENTWTTLRVWLTTWDIQHVISYKDIMLARYMDKIFAEYAPKKENSYNKDRVERERNEFKENIRTLIAEDKLETAFEKLNEFAILNRESSFINNVTLITGKLNRLINSERMGTLTREDADVEYNKINKAVLGLLD